MPFSVARNPVKIDKSKHGSFGESSGFTTIVKSIVNTKTTTTKPSTQKTAIAKANSHSGFSVISATKVAVAVAPAIAAKITKTKT